MQFQDFSYYAYNFISIIDYVLVPFYLLIIYGVAIFIQNKDYPEGHPWRPYFMKGLTFKIVGAIMIGFVYQYYYGSGDTALYFVESKVINSAFSESPERWLKLILHIPSWYDGDYYKYISQMPWYDEVSEFTTCAIAAFVGIFTMTTYLPTAILFGTFAFTGLWALFKTFATKYPAYTKYIAWSTLYIPSTIMWGSGLFKDTICMFSVGWLTYSIFNILINKRVRIGLLLMTIMSFILIARIKVYILLAFLPALLLWILFTYLMYIPSKAGRMVVKVGVIGICVGGFLFFSQKFAAELGKYSLENVAQTSYVTGSYIAQTSGDQGSTYDLGPIEPNIGSMLKKFPMAVNVTLFRPYLWETRKPIQFLSSIEAAMFLWVTIKIIFGIGLKTVRKTIAEDPTIQFCLIFTVIFAFAVGLSSGNFGTLSRYRIPCLPFYGLSLVLIYYKNRPIENNILSFNFR